VPAGAFVRLVASLPPRTLAGPLRWQRGVPRRSCGTSRHEPQDLSWGSASGLAGL